MTISFCLSQNIPGVYFHGGYILDCYTGHVPFTAKFGKTQWPYAVGFRNLTSIVSLVCRKTKYRTKYSLPFAAGKRAVTYIFICFRVATAPGKQGIWMLTFPDRENTGNLVNLIFTQGKLWQHLGIF